MDKYRKGIQCEAEKQYRVLQNVEPHLPSILFSRYNKGSTFPFGSYVNGTYTSHSDIDVYIENNSSHFGSGDSRAASLSQHLQRNFGIASEVTGNILFCTYMGVKVNVVAAQRHKIEQSQARDQQISGLVARFPLYCEVVRFLKLFAETYIERFPRGRGNYPIYPGSHFYTVVTAIALNLLDNPRANLRRKPYESTIKEVANFIGEDMYMQQKAVLVQFELDPTKKFQNNNARNDFNRCFRALVAHIERGVTLPRFKVNALPAYKPTAELLALTADDEALRTKPAIYKQPKSQKQTKQRRPKQVQQQQTAMPFISFVPAGYNDYKDTHSDYDDAEDYSYKYDSDRDYGSDSDYGYKYYDSDRDYGYKYYSGYDYGYKYRDSDIDDSYSTNNDDFDY